MVPLILGDPHMYSDSFQASGTVGPHHAGHPGLGRFRVM